MRLLVEAVATSYCTARGKLPRVAIAAPHVFSAHAWLTLTRDFWWLTPARRRLPRVFVRTWLSLAPGLQPARSGFQRVVCGCHGNGSLVRSPLEALVFFVPHFCTIIKVNQRQYGLRHNFAVSLSQTKKKVQLIFKLEQHRHYWFVSAI